MIKSIGECDLQSLERLHVDDIRRDRRLVHVVINTAVEVVR